MTIFDDYRSKYQDLSPLEHSNVYDRIAKLYGDQQHYNPALVEPIAAGVVVELGGWRGELAAHILPRNDRVVSWTNHEICRWAAISPVCDDPRYESVWTRDRFAWDAPEFAGDLLVLSHVIEHLSEAHALALIEAFARFGRVYVDAPLLGDVWENTWTTHILPWTWAQFLDRAGCAAEKLSDSVYDAQAWLLTPSVRPSA